MNQLSTLGAFLLFSFLSFTQSSLSVKITTLNGEPFSYCKLTLLQDSLGLKTALTDSLGNYVFENIQSGMYQLNVKVPFTHFDTTLNVSGKSVFQLALKNEEELDDIVIVSQQKTLVRKIDRTLFYPESIPALIGGDASDVIAFAPGVFIKGESIELANGNPVQAMINDKLIYLNGGALISFLRSIPTEDIQYIEIIPIAPIKYAASVSGGLINIKLIVGSKSRYSKGNIGGSITQQFYTSGDVNGSYSYRSGKFSLYSTLNAGQFITKQTGNKSIYNDTLTWGESVQGKSTDVHGSGTLGMNYAISSNTEIGILAQIEPSRSSEQNSSYINNTNASGTYLQSLSNNSLGSNKGLNSAVNMNLAKTFDSLGRKIDVNMDYTFASKTRGIDFRTNQQVNSSDSSVQSNNEIGTNAQFISGGIDYIHPTKKVNYTCGVRYSYTENSNDLSVYSNTVLDTTKSNAFQYQEHIQAAYVSMEWKHKKWTFQLGLRGENTHIKGTSPTIDTTISRSYFQLAPKVFAMVEVNENRSWNFFYGRMFIRPEYYNLNPFRYATSLYSYQVGNPLLNPVVFHMINVSTNIRQLQLGMNLGYMKNSFTNVTVYDNATQQQVTTFANLFDSKDIGIYASFLRAIKRRTTLKFGGSIRYDYRTVVSTISPQNLQYLTADAYLDYSYVFDKKKTFIANASLSLMSPYYEQISRRKVPPRLSFEIKKTFLNNRLVLTASTFDPFRWYKKAQTTFSNGTKITENYNIYSQSFMFSLLYKLGNKNLQVNEHGTNATGEANRLGK